ncbi:RNA polymerase sigma factor [Asticcacaulis sp. YBE204]|uniref:RNA polymerase sigma factor n=1 Tax=Asticcacaulis sp. YBE204 TaxID=1282363 RepID=UPI0003C3EE35|nr:sigma-70 family RNA polymerase sigma factor [Asticcacaulis sp. YBE204]ESQ79760.1 hypothetical protein AEYBE204_07910 [Asticcacaulis sp. YBE204]
MLVATLEAARTEPTQPAQEENTLSLNFLIERVSVGDRPALRSLYELIGPRLYGMLLRMVRKPDVAEDLLQDIFVTIWQKAGQFDVTRGNAYAWLFSITRRKAIDKLRISRRELPQAEWDMNGTTVSSDKTWLTAETHIALKAGLQTLSPDIRRALHLCYIYGLTHEELAQVMQIPLGTAKTWVRRGLAQLRDCLKER